MRREKVDELLKSTGIPVEHERAVPINGHNLPLPYMVIRTDELDEKSDNGRVCAVTINWTVALFSANKDFALECKIRRALAGAGDVTTTRYPDGVPYQTNFTFTTKGGLNDGETGI